MISTKQRNGPRLNALARLQVAGLALLALAILTPAHEVAAASTNESRFLPWEKGSVKLGGFFANFSSDLGFGINSSDHTVNAEDVLGLDSSLTVFRAGVMYRPGSSLRHQFDLAYGSYHRDGDATFSTQIDLDGKTYPLGTQVESYFDFDIIRGTYSYAFLQNDRARLALGLGVYVIPLSYGLNLETTGGRTSVDGADTTLPLPALALRTEWQFLPRFFLNASAEAMYLNVSSFEGALLDADVGLEYRPWKHFGMGVGYSAMAVKVESSSDSNYPGGDFMGTVDVRYSGLLLYGKWSF